MKRSLKIAIALIVLSYVPSCGQKTDPDTPSELDLSLNVPSELEVDPGNDAVCQFNSGKGPVTSDQVVLRSAEGGKDFTCAIKSISGNSFTYGIPRDFVAGTYNFCIKRGTLVKGYGKTVYTIRGSAVIKPTEGSTVYGLVSCAGKAVAGAVISDGVEVVQTDAEGVYQMPSKKKNGFVFISVPSGYEVECNGVLPQIKINLSQAANVAERVDFQLYPSGDQTNHTMMFFGDMHMANRTNDRSQFRTFTSELSQYMADHSSEKVYAMTLGDMTWDLYWYSNNYCFTQYLSDINIVRNLPIFHTIGNHDHNMKTSVVGSSAGWDAVDWDTGLEYRSAIAPSNYSFNIGKIHYISLDNIFCKNTTGGGSDDRKYDQAVCNEGLAWLRKDLAFVSKSTPVVVAMHAAVFNQNGNADLDNTDALTACFSGFSSVTFVTGHSHKVWNVAKGNIREYNSGAVCAAWWWAGKYNPTLNIAQDGAPNGYRIMDVKGSTMTSRFKAIGRNNDVQFRTYDRNCICITPASCGVTGSTNAANFSADLSQYGGYNTSSGANEVLINVWDRDDKWKVEVTENGQALSVSRVTSYDPLFLIAYTGPRYKESTTTSWTPYKTNHLYKVKASSATSTLEIKVTDDEGRAYCETMKRPKEFSIAQYK